MESFENYAFKHTYHKVGLIGISVAAITQCDDLVPNTDVEYGFTLVHEDGRVMTFPVNAIQLIPEDNSAIIDVTFCFEMVEQGLTAMLLHKL